VCLLKWEEVLTTRPTKKSRLLVKSEELIEALDDGLNAVIEALYFAR
jgi:hypothetical protein